MSVVFFVVLAVAVAYGLNRLTSARPYERQRNVHDRLAEARRLVERRTSHR